MTTIAALFENTRDADKSIEDLKVLGLNKDAIGIMAQQKALESSTTKKEDVGTRASDGAKGGGAVGGIAGLLVGIGALVIPGLGPIIAAGTFGSIVGATAVGAGVGAAAGGAVGALTGMGLSKEDAHFYAEGVKRGGILVTAKAEDTQVQQVTDLFRRDGAVDVNTRRQELMNSGWSQFDESGHTPHN